jgi:hypothetical protein
VAFDKLRPSGIDANLKRSAQAELVEAGALSSELGGVAFVA